MVNTIAKEGAVHATEASALLIHESGKRNQEPGRHPCRTSGGADGFTEPRRMRVARYRGRCPLLQRQSAGGGRRRTLLRSPAGASAWHISDKSALGDRLRRARRNRVRADLAGGYYRRHVDFRRAGRQNPVLGGFSGRPERLLLLSPGRNTVRQRRSEEHTSE